MDNRRFLALLLMILVLLFTVSTASALTLYAAHEEGELNIREKPYGERIGYLLPGDSGEFIRQSGNWVLLKIGIEAGEGWVNAKYLTAFPEAAGTYANASGGRLRIRETPGGKTAGWLSAGKTVEVLAILPDEDGKLWGRTHKGYVAMEWLEVSE